jgi:SAM-dependent methyltransferase
MRRWRLAEYEKMMVTGFVRSCPVCGYRGEFVPVGEPPRLDGMCPSCRCRERHRLFRLWLDREGRIDETKSVLHFAPEHFLRPYIRALSGSYVTADLMDENVDRKLDIEKLDLPDASFDVIIAHQILEHVDHKKALAECFRCLAPSGLMIVTTPIIDAWEATYVNPEIQSKRERVRHFGQHDHTRYFGRDLKDDMRAAGFVLNEYVAVEPDVSEFALIRGETLFLLEKPTVNAARSQGATRKANRS